MQQQPISMDGKEFDDLNKADLHWEIVPQARTMLEMLKTKGEEAYEIMLRENGLQELFKDDERLSQLAELAKVWTFLFYRLKRFCKPPNQRKPELYRKLNKLSNKSKKAKHVASSAPPPA